VKRFRFGWIAHTALLAALLVVSSTGASAQPVEPTLQQRLDRLTEEMERQRRALHIPGMAIAIVKGDEIIYSHGFGSADLENNTPVTPSTLFAIGSSTKAFTASLVGMMVDEGRMDWDDPVTKYLPYFELKIDTDDPEAAVTIRDLLAHRSGFTRMGILWAGAAVPREEVLRTAIRAEPWSPFREKFFYNNVTFLAAGMASGIAAGSSWEDLLAERIFTPLGMNSSSTSIGVAQEDARLSLGYTWNEETRTYEVLPMRPLGSIAPAGAINSNVLDMAQWLRFQLGHGSFGGQVLLSEAQHRETWSKQIEVAPGVDYGMGWMLRSVADQKVVEHGGNIDGFAAEVALFPDADLGFVLLTNVTATPLQQVSIKLVADALLADWSGESEPSVASAVSLDVYAGKYEANFGPFKETFFTVTARDGRLFIDVPGQMDYQLEPPDEEGKWYFSLTNEVAVSFDHQDDDSVPGLKMYQAGMTFELPREGVERPVEIDLSGLRPYLGTYRSEKADLDFEVKISNQRLAVDVPGEMVYELFPPNEDDMWVFRPTDRVAVSFIESDAGEVTSMKMFRDGSERLELLRVSGPEQEALPTEDEIRALNGNTANAAPGSYRIAGRVRLVNAGLDGRVTFTSDGSHRSRSDTDFGRFGWIHEVVSEDQGWVDSNIQPYRKLEGKYLTQSIVTHALQSPLGWLQIFDTVTVTGVEMLDDRKAYTLILREGELPVISASIDAETGDLLRYEMSILDPRLGVTVKTLTRMEDYRDVDGIRVAFRRVSSNDFTGKSVVEIETFETNIEIDKQTFSSPDRN
jgi:CubicO group peptidase (beta-lactamase class C family)